MADDRAGPGEPRGTDKSTHSARPSAPADLLGLARRCYASLMATIQAVERQFTLMRLRQQQRYRQYAVNAHPVSIHVTLSTPTVSTGPRFRKWLKRFAWLLQLAWQMMKEVYFVWRVWQDLLRVRSARA